MGLNNIIFNRTNGLGRLATTEDDISGLLAYIDDNDLPSGFTTSDRVKKIFSLQQAENLGIVDTHSDETVATGGNVAITAAGGGVTYAEGDVLNITIDEVLLGSYTCGAAETETTVATGLRAAINVLTPSHGFSATGSTVNVALTAPAKMGIVPNGATLAFTSSGTGAATVTQFTNGLGSFLSVLHYHISEFFRYKQDGTLYVGLYTTPETFDGSEVETMVDASEGKIRTLGVYLHTETYASSQLSAVQTYAENARTKHRNVFVEFHADMTGLSLSSLTDLRSLTASKVNVNISEDGNFWQAAYSATKSYVLGDKVKWLNKTYKVNQDCTGKAPYNTSYFSVVSLNLPDIVGYSVGTLGNELGVTAQAEVHQSIANVELFPVNSGNTLDVIGFGTGDLYNDLAKSLLDTLDNYHYTFLRKFEGNANTYYNKFKTAIADTSDYALGSNNRTMDKAERLVYLAMLPFIENDVNVDDEGNVLYNDKIRIESAGFNALLAMANNISQDPDDPTLPKASFIVQDNQNLLTDPNLKTTLKIRPKAIISDITVNNSYSLNV